MQEGLWPVGPGWRFGAAGARSRGSQDPVSLSPGRPGGGRSRAAPGPGGGGPACSGAPPPPEGPPAGLFTLICFCLCFPALRALALPAALPPTPCPRCAPPPGPRTPPRPLGTPGRRQGPQDVGPEPQAARPRRSTGVHLQGGAWEPGTSSRISLGSWRPAALGVGGCGPVSIGWNQEAPQKTLPRADVSTSALPTTTLCSRQGSLVCAGPGVRGVTGLKWLLSWSHTPCSRPAPAQQPAERREGHRWEQPFPLTMVLRGVSMSKGR